MDYTSRYLSPLGYITLASDGEALIGLWFEGQKHFAGVLGSQHRECDDLPVFAETKRWLDSYFSGQVPDFTPKLMLRATPFRQAVWEILLTIPYGKTMTYGEIAKQYVETCHGASLQGVMLHGASLQSAPLQGATLHGALLQDSSLHGASLKGMFRSTKSMSAQAVGGAVGCNPISLIIPCHRVIGANGSLTGYAGGLERKKYLLEMEQRLKNSISFP